MAARKTVTVVFSDIANFTPLGEALDPEVMRKVMEQYYAVVRRELERHGGTVEKFIGDAAMAVFGIPTVHDDDALRAVRAAVDLRTALGGLNQELEETHGVRLAIRTGVNTGEVVAGDPTDRQSFATGAAVATAQRLEAAARSGEILLGDSTYRLVSNAVLVEPMEPLELKGKAEPVRAWRLLGVVEGAPPFPRRLDAPMVGREDELASLRAELERGRPRADVPAGDDRRPGRDRQVAARERALLVDPRRATTLVGRCLAYGEGITYWPLRGIVLSATGSLTQERDRGVPRRRGRRGRGSQNGSRAPSAREEAPPGGEETFWAVRRFLEHVARERPVILGIDELQWAEPTFLDLLEYLVGWTTRRADPGRRPRPARAAGATGRPGATTELARRRARAALRTTIRERLVEALGGGSSIGASESGSSPAPKATRSSSSRCSRSPSKETRARRSRRRSTRCSLRGSTGCRAEERAVLERAAVIGREFTAGAVDSARRRRSRRARRSSPWSAGI